MGSDPVFKSNQVLLLLPLPVLPLLKIIFSHLFIVPIVLKIQPGLLVVRHFNINYFAHGINIKPPQHPLTFKNSLNVGCTSGDSCRHWTTMRFFGVALNGVEEAVGALLAIMGWVRVLQLVQVYHGWA